MDKNDIIEKLRNFLRKHPTFKEECEVVYLMVEIRKILENWKNTKYRSTAGNSYEMLYFYCNWIVHEKLSKQSADFVIKKFNQCIDENKNLEEIKRGMKANKNFFMLNDLQCDLKNFFGDCSLPQDILNESWKWRRFRKLLLEIISESVIDLSKSKKIASLNVKGNKGKYYYRFKLNFYVKNLKNEDKNVIKIKLMI